MHASVLESWHAFSTPFEVRVHSLYCDVLGLITTAVGVLVDPVELALKMPWRLPDGSLASRDEVLRQWRAVKAQADYLKKRHWKYAAEVTTIRLSDEDIDRIVDDKLASNEAHIRRWLPGFDDAPADAQLAILSMAWAVGPAFNTKFPNWTRQALAGKWDDCAVSGQIRTTGADGTFNAGVVPRNRANQLCFENAAFVAAHGLDHSVLYWPGRAQDTIVLPPPPEDNPPLSRDLIALATAAADEARHDNLERLRLDVMRDMSGLDSEFPDDEFVDREAPTVKTEPPKSS